MNNQTTQEVDTKASYTFNIGAQRRERILNFKEKKRKQSVILTSIEKCVNELLDIALDKEKC